MLMSNLLIECEKKDNTLSLILFLVNIHYFKDDIKIQLTDFFIISVKQELFNKY